MKKVLGITLAVALLLGILTGCSGEKPTSITMSAAEVDGNGEVLKRCEITVDITKKSDFGLKYTPYECTVSFHKINALMGSSLFCTQFGHGLDYLFTGFGYNPADNLMKGIVLYMDEKQENCLIQIDENARYFVASTDPDFDPAAVYKSLSEKLSERFTYG